MKNWKFWLILIGSLAIFLRSIPWLTHALWGCDFGIYYGLTKMFIDSGNLYPPYDGWGGSYQYFPMLYIIAGGAHWMTGMDAGWLLSKIAPIFGGATVFLLYFIVHSLTGDKKIALLSSALLAVAPIYLYQTSHAAPLTMGHFFMLLSLLFFIKYRKQKSWILDASLYISTLALILSHHLTTYFYLISIIFITFYRNFNSKEWTPKIKRDVVYILFALSSSFFYWSFIATPVYSFMGSGVPLPSWTIMLSCYLLFGLSFIAISLKRKMGIEMKIGEPELKGSVAKGVVASFIGIGIISFIAFIGIPGTNIKANSLLILYALPSIMLVALAASGFKHLSFIKGGEFIKGWLFALLISFIYSVMTWNGVLYPERHLEYLMIPVCVSAAVFIRRASIDLPKKPVFGFFAAILLVNAVSAYPMEDPVDRATESIYEPSINAIEWMEGNATGMVASDHRLCNLLWAEGLNTTRANGWEIERLWMMENWTQCYGEMEKNGSRIEYILMDDVMLERGVMTKLYNIIEMTNKSYEKFSHRPFKLIYRNATLNKDEEEIHWSEVYEVNWSYIELNLESWRFT